MGAMGCRAVGYAVGLLFGADAPADYQYRAAYRSWCFFMADYNTMLKKEKAQWNEKTLCRFVGLLLLVFTGFLVAALAGVFHERMDIFGVCLGLGMAALVPGIIYLNTGQHFKKTESI